MCTGLLQYSTYRVVQRCQFGILNAENDQFGIFQIGSETPQTNSIL